MNTFRTVTITLCVISFMSILAACEKENKPDYKLFLIKVDSVLVPDNIIANEPFDITFTGTVGTNGCYQFYKFETNSEADQIVVKVWGRFYSKQEVCTDVMVYLGDEKLTLRIEEPGHYILKVQQPDESYLTESILIE